VGGGIGIRPQVQLGYEVPPAEHLAPERGAPVDLDGEIDEAQDALVGPPQPLPIARPEELPGPVHLVGDHQDPVAQGEGGSPLRREAGVLRHDNGSPSPISAKVRARTLSAAAAAT
jgi:hypothetical protein